MALPGVGVAGFRHGQVSSACRGPQPELPASHGESLSPRGDLAEMRELRTVPGNLRHGPAREPTEGSGFPLCYDCYERQTGGAYVSLDEYWDGRTWIPLAKGE